MILVDEYVIATFTTLIFNKFCVIKEGIISGVTPTQLYQNEKILGAYFCDNFCHDFIVTSTHFYIPACINIVFRL